MKQLDPNWIAQRLAGEPSNELGQLVDELSLPPESALRRAIERPGLEAELATALLAGFRADDARVLHRAKPFAWFRERVARVLGVRFQRESGTIDEGCRAVLERIALDVLEADTRPLEVVERMLPRFVQASLELGATALSEAVARARDHESSLLAVLARSITKQGDLRTYELSPCRADAAFVVAEALEALGVRTVAGGSATVDALARAVGELDYAPTTRFSVGDVVRHPKFGRGVVVALFETSVEIDFAGDRRRLAGRARP